MPDAITGKPEPLLMHLAAERWGMRRPLVVGDRIDTDIRGGNKAGMDTLLVLTGVTGPEQLSALREAEPHDRPTHIARDLRALRAPAAHSRVLERAGSADTDELAEVRSLLRRAWGD
jgi:ribonucleotide monophosphatase NagD (HAD superfamily)